jgi:hypothetical protein
MVIEGGPTTTIAVPDPTATTVAVPDPTATTVAVPDPTAKSMAVLDLTATTIAVPDPTAKSMAVPSHTQVGAFGDPGRDPRGWAVTVAYAALVPDTQLGVKAAVRKGGGAGE